MWRFVAPHFESNYRIILFDYVGSGQSDTSQFNPQKYSTLQGYVNDLIEVCDAAGVSGVHLVGHSVSSMIGALASIERPDLFKSLIMIGPSPRYVNDFPNYYGGFEQKDLEALIDMMDKNYLGWANFLAPNVMKNESHPELTQELESSFCSTDPAISKVFARATFFSDNREDLQNIPVPTLIMQCAEDMLAPASVGEYLNDKIPKGTLVHLSATGHCPHMSQPAETITVIQEYLARMSLNDPTTNANLG